jgi:hypothetical protein
VCHQGPDLLGVPLDERDAVHGATTAREDVHRLAADRVDEPVQVVGLLASSVRGLRSTPRGSYVTTVRSLKKPASDPKPAAPIGDPMRSSAGSVLESLRRMS